MPIRCDPENERDEPGWSDASWILLGSNPVRGFVLAEQFFDFVLQYTIIYIESEPFLRTVLILRQ